MCGWNEDSGYFDCVVEPGVAPADVPTLCTDLAGGEWQETDATEGSGEDVDSAEPDSSGPPENEDGADEEPGDTQTGEADAALPVSEEDTAAVDPTDVGAGTVEPEDAGEPVSDDLVRTSDSGGCMATRHSSETAPLGVVLLGLLVIGLRRPLQTNRGREW